MAPNYLRLIDGSQQQPAPTDGSPYADDYSQQPIAGLPDDKIILQWVLECRKEAYDARRSRMRQNNANRDAYMGIQDWSHKQPGQSTEFLPKVGTASEQFSAFIKKSMLNFGNWFEIRLSEQVKPYITDSQVRNLMQLFFDKMPAGAGKFKSIETVFADGAKVGCLESLMIFKVYGKDVNYSVPYVEPGASLVDLQTGKTSRGPSKLRRRNKAKWHLSVDLVRSEDYLPDPTGRGLYEIHEVERDYADVLELAKAGVYDLEAVKAIGGDTPKPENDKRRPQQLGQDRSVPAPHRKRITISEFWGNILNEDGEIVAENVLCTVANKQHLIRRPVENPFWHGQSPFIAEPLIRVPFSVWHKALYDSASSLNFALNEVFNLMIDGGISAVWGIKQLRSSYLADPKQVEGGIRQGMTIVVNENLPDGQKVVETVASGQVPQDAMAIFQMLDQEFMQSALTNSLKLGSLPAGNVKATTVVNMQQNQDVTLDSISMDLEVGVMEKVLTLSWLNILQHIDDIDRDDLVKTIGRRAAVLMLSLSEAERYVMFASCASFKAVGLSGTLAAVQDFQKLMAVLQAAATNPLLGQAFLQQYSPTRVLNLLIKHMGIDPDQIANSPEESANLPQFMQQLSLFAQLFGGAGQGQGAGAPPGAGASAAPGISPPGGQMSGQGAAMTAGVNQQIQPLTGLPTTS